MEDQKKKAGMNIVKILKYQGGTPVARALRFYRMEVGFAKVTWLLVKYHEDEGYTLWFTMDEFEKLGAVILKRGSNYQHYYRSINKATKEYNKMIKH